MRKKQWFLMICLSLLSLGLILPSGARAENAEVITHSSIAPGSVDADAVKKIYSGNMTKWPDGSRIIVATMDKAPFHEEFLKTYVGKTPSQFTATWKKLMFTGKGKMPTNFDTAKDLIDFVTKTQGAIGYVNAGSNPQGISVQK